LFFFSDCSTEVLGENMSLRERALQAWEEYKRELEEDRRKRLEEFLSEAVNVAKERFGGEWKIDVERRVIVCEDIALRPYCDRRYWQDCWEFRLIGRCPKCGEEILSRPFNNLEGLGGALAGERWDIHYCSVEREEEEERLCRKLLKLLAEALAPFLGCEE